MKCLAACFFAVLLLAVSLPASAQTTPTPSAQTIVSDVVEATQTLGLMTVVVLALVAVMVGVVAFFVIVALRLGLPLVTTVQKLIASQGELQRAADEKERDAANYRMRTAEALERTVNVMANIESKTEAQAARKTAVEIITAHIDTGMGAMQKQLTDAVTTLKDATGKLDNFASKHDLTDALSPVTRELHELTERLTAVERRMFPPDPAAPSPEPPAAGSAPDAGTAP